MALTVEAIFGGATKALSPVRVAGPIGIGRVSGLPPGQVHLRIRAENAGLVQGPPNEAAVYIRP